MKYYVTYPINQKAGENNYHIMKINEADEADFLEDYGDKVIASGNSLMEVLLNFEQAKMMPGK